MDLVKAVIAAGSALAFANPAFAGRSEEQIVQHDRAVKQMQMRAQQGLAGAAGEQGRLGLASKASPRAWNMGHPNERVRR